MLDLVGVFFRPLDLLVVPALQSTVAALEALDLLLVLGILLLEHPMLRHDARPLLHLLAESSALGSLLLEHLGQLAPLFVDADHVPLELLDG